MSEYVPGSAMPALFGGFKACCALVVRAKGVCGGAVLVPVLLRVGFSVGLNCRAVKGNGGSYMVRLVKENKFYLELG